MGAAQRAEQDAVKFVSTVLAIVVLIVLVQNSGGLNAILGTLFGGVNTTVSTLLNARSPQAS